MFWFSILMMKFFASESCWYQTNGTHKLIFSHAGDWVSLFKYTQFFCELLLHSGLYGYFYWFSLPVSVRAQVILPKTGSGKVMRRGGAFGGKVGWAPLRLWWPYTSVEVALKCRKWRKALSSSLSLSLAFSLLSLLWSGTFWAQWCTFPQKLRCSPSRGFEMHCEAHSLRREQRSSALFKSNSKTSP